MQPRLPPSERDRPMLGGLVRMPDGAAVVYDIRACWRINTQRGLLLDAVCD